jgi:hypothetical protein
LRKTGRIYTYQHFKIIPRIKVAIRKLNFIYLSEEINLKLLGIILKCRQEKNLSVTVQGTPL